jgi:Sulfotransferase family
MRLRYHLKFLRTAKDKALYEISRSFPVPIINFDKKFVFFWSAKSGCTQTTRLILEDMGITQPVHTVECGENQPDYVDEMRRTYYERFKINHEKTYEYAIDPEYLNIKVVRNPERRTVSSFLMLMRHYEGMNLDPTGLLGKFLEHSGKREILQLSFADACHYLDSADPCTLDWHLQQQVHPFEYLGGARIDRAILLKNLDQGFTELNEQYGLDIDLAGLGRSFEHHNQVDDSLDRNIALAPYADYAARIPGYECFYNDELREIIQRVYRQDFEHYHFAR